MSNQKKRNFQIEAFKHRVVVDPKYADKTWKVLEHAIREIYNHNASGLSFEELYRFVPFLSFLLLYNFHVFFFCFNSI
jgi:cullin 3